jgi:hypothetical protein
MFGNERILAMAAPFSHNKILDIFKKAALGHRFLDSVDEVPDNGTVMNRRAEELLKRVKNGQGWSTLEEAITEVEQVDARCRGRGCCVAWFNSQAYGERIGWCAEGTVEFVWMK